MKYANGVKATTLTTGTGDVTLAAVSGYVPFPLAFSVGDTIPYAIRNDQNWEWGVGTVQAGGVLERTTVASTLVAGVFTDVAPARITLTGVSEVVCAVTAEDYRALNDSLLAHTTDVANPHGVTAAQANADPVGTAAGLVAAHEAALDPHDAYALEADLGTAAYLDAGTAVGDLVQVQAGGALPALDASALLNLPASGVTDHGALTGLVDDDHTQYHTDARGDARYAPTAKGVTGGDSHNHDGGDGAQIAYASLSGLPTLGSAAAAATGDFEPSGAVSTHNAVATAHGISAWGATLVDDADANTARSTLGLGTAATTASTAYATSTQGANADSHASNTSNPHAVTAAQVGAPTGSGNSTGTNTGNETTTTIGALINSATSKTTPIDADRVGLWDSVSGLLEHLSWANLKTALSSVFVLLAGKAGGQTIVGGTDAGESLTLQSTTHATKGKIKVASGTEFVYMTGTGGKRSIANETDSADPSALTVVLLSAASSVWPSKIGAVSKPVGSAGTNSDPAAPVDVVKGLPWVNDGGYSGGTIASISTIVGGYDHVNNQEAGTIIGGGHNYIQYNAGGHATIVGGSNNRNASERGTIVGGLNNTVLGTLAAIVGGVRCTVNGKYGGVLAGADNTILNTSEYSAAIGGSGHSLGGSYSVTLGGAVNTVTGAYAAIVGGSSCTVAGPRSCIVGGGNNVVSSNNSVILAGDGNVIGATHYAAVVCGVGGISEGSGGIVNSRNKLVVSGDCQTVRFTYGIRTTSASLVNTSAGSSEMWALSGVKTALALQATLVGMDEGTGAVAIYTFAGGVYWDGVSSSTVYSSGGSGSTRDFVQVVDNIGVAGLPHIASSSGIIRPKVYGKAGTNIKWSCSVTAAVTRV